MNIEVDQFGRNTNQSNINTSNDDRSKKILDSLSEIKEQLQNKNFSPKSEPSISIPKKDIKNLNFEELNVNKLEGIGYIPADTPPAIVLLDTVGAIANT